MNTEYKGMVEELKKSLARAKANRAHDYYADSPETAINALEKAITMLQMIKLEGVNMKEYLRMKDAFWCKIKFGNHL